jgi:deoxyribodipyrimidine photo-lyase
MEHSLCWLRRDLRLHDHHALSASLKNGKTTLVFVFDTHILNNLKDPSDRRITYIVESLEEIERDLRKKNSSLIILYGKPEIEIPKLAVKLKVSGVFCNRDYEPYAKKRDEEVAKVLKKSGISFHQYKDSVFFEGDEVLTGNGEPYKVYTPYKNNWLHQFEASGRAVPDYRCALKNLREFSNAESIFEKDRMKVIGFKRNPPLLTGGTKPAMKRLKNFGERMDDYKEARSFPSVEGTSLLSVYLRFGNISVRDMIRGSLTKKSEGASTWLNEIIWRDFYQMILDHFPRVVDGAFRPEYDKLKFPGTEATLKKWCEGQTGVPIVDAAMRCLNETGLMHNRLRMITSSYLVKILQVDWKKGEKYFAEKLLDFDLASNNGGWQWSAGTGCDAQPYFRIFNPYAQSEKFDPEGKFIRIWCPELNSLSNKEIHRPENVSGYPKPIANYELKRLKTLKLYEAVKKKT